MKLFSLVICFLVPLEKDFSKGNLSYKLLAKLRVSMDR